MTNDELERGYLNSPASSYKPSLRGFKLKGVCWCGLGS